jgi:putative transposase
MPLRMRPSGNAIFDYIEIFYNRQRCHSGLEYRTPIEHELHCQNPSQTARGSFFTG